MPGVIGLLLGHVASILRLPDFKAPPWNAPSTSGAVGDAGAAPGAGTSEEREIALAVEEYETVRKEELVGMQSQIGTLRYGITGCVLLIGLAAQQHNDRYLGWALALALVPLVILFSAVIWMGEYERMARAGHYVGILERRINRKARSREPDYGGNGPGGSTAGEDSTGRNGPGGNGALGDGPLGWERWLREGGSAQSRIVGGHHRYLAIASVFLGLHLTAVAMGLHFYWHQHANDPSHKWLIPIALIANTAILLMLVGYFRSSYERLRDFASDPDERRPPVRQRMRMRVRLYGVFLAVGFLSTPIFLWPLGVLGVRLVDRIGAVGDVPGYWIALPVALWMAGIPLVASHGMMRELLSQRVESDEELGERERIKLQRGGALSHLSGWEREHLSVARSQEPNAPSIGHGKTIAITRGALADEESLPGTLAHEVGHRRLQHLHPLALSYLYLWLYFYYDDRVTRRTTRPSDSRLVRTAHHTVRAIFTLVALPGWLAWVALRWGWRTAEYDADRYACMSGVGPALEAALLKHERSQSPRPARLREWLRWSAARIERGSALGYLPVPDEHPSPRRRLKHLKTWMWTRTPSR